MAARIEKKRPKRDPREPKERRGQSVSALLGRSGDPKGLPRDSQERPRGAQESPKTLSRPSSYQKPKSRFVQHPSANITISEVGRALDASAGTGDSIRTNGPTGFGCARCARGAPVWEHPLHWAPEGTRAAGAKGGGQGSPLRLGRVRSLRLQAALIRSQDRKKSLAA